MQKVRKQAYQLAIHKLSRVIYKFIPTFGLNKLISIARSISLPKVGINLLITLVNSCVAS